MHIETKRFTFTTANETFVFAMPRAGARVIHVTEDGNLTAGTITVYGSASEEMADATNGVQLEQVAFGDVPDTIQGSQLIANARDREPWPYYVIVGAAIAGGEFYVDIAWEEW